MFRIFSKRRAAGHRAYSQSLTQMDGRARFVLDRDRHVRRRVAAAERFQSLLPRQLRMVVPRAQMRQYEMRRSPIELIPEKTRHGRVGQMAVTPGQSLFEAPGVWPDP